MTVLEPFALKLAFFPCLADINECQVFRNLCVHGRCENVFGMFRCICNQGYTLDITGGNCTGKFSGRAALVRAGNEVRCCQCARLCNIWPLPQSDNTQIEAPLKKRRSFFVCSVPGWQWEPILHPFCVQEKNNRRFGKSQTASS